MDCLPAVRNCILAKSESQVIHKRFFIIAMFPVSSEAIQWNFPEHFAAAEYLLGGNNIEGLHLQSLDICHILVFMKIFEVTYSYKKTE